MPYQNPNPREPRRACFFRRSDGGSSETGGQRGNNTSMSITAYPFTLAAKIHCTLKGNDGSATRAMPIQLSTSGNLQRFRPISGGSSFWRAHASDVGGTGTVQATSNCIQSPHATHSVVAVYSTANLRYIYVDDYWYSSDTASGLVTPALTEVSVGATPPGTTSWTNGFIWDVAIYNIAMTKQEAFRLAWHRPGDVRRDALTNWWPLFDASGVDVIGGKNLTWQNGAPVVIGMPRNVLRRIIPASSAIALAMTLAGTSASGQAANAILAAALDLAGESESAQGASAIRDFASSIQGTSQSSQLAQAIRDVAAAMVGTSASDQAALSVLGVALEAAGTSSTEQAAQAVLAAALALAGESASGQSATSIFAFGLTADGTSASSQAANAVKPTLLQADGTSASSQDASSVRRAPTIGATGVAVINVAATGAADRNVLAAGEANQDVPLNGALP